jgi:hypothetical protein
MLYIPVRSKISFPPWRLHVIPGSFTLHSSIVYACPVLLTYGLTEIKSSKGSDLLPAIAIFIAIATCGCFLVRLQLMQAYI